MSSGKHRPERVAALVKETLAGAVASEVKDPRVGFVTVTDVSVSPDCTHATVWVSILGSADDKAKTMEGLESARGFLRTVLARTLSLRTAPELHFKLDRGLEHAAKINRLIAELRDEERS